MTVSYVIFPSASTIALFSLCKKWPSYLSHAISPYPYGKMINWTSPFYLSFCYDTVLPRMTNILMFMNRVISIICISQLYLMLFHFASYGICTNSDNHQMYYLINLYFFDACVGQPKSVLTIYLGTLLGVIKLCIIIWLIY